MHNGGVTPHQAGASQHLASVRQIWKLGIYGACRLHFLLEILPSATTRRTTGRNCTVNSSHAYKLTLLLYQPFLYSIRTKARHVLEAFSELSNHHTNPSIESNR
jgi:hypothetical protein